MLSNTVSRTPALTLLIPALLLSACGGTHNRGIESVHQPVVSRADYAFDLATGIDGLDAGERDRLAGWMASLRLGFGDQVSVDDPARSGAARAQVAAEAARHGLLLADVPPVTAGMVTPGTLRVVVTRMTASVPGCPDHSRERQPNFTAETSSNFGCAINSNLAAMVARPDDLVRGQSGAASSDPASGTKAIETFRKATPTGSEGLRPESTGKGSN